MWLELLLLILGASVAYCFEVWLMVLLFSSVLQMIMIYWHVKGHSDVQSENEITVVNIRCSEAQMFENFDTSSKDIWRQSSSPGVSTPPHHSKLHSKCQTPPERQANKKTDTKDNQTKSQTVMSVVSVCLLCRVFSACLSGGVWHLIGLMHCLMHPLSTIGDRAFRLWNTVPWNVTSASSLTVLMKRLKTHFFSCSFFPIPVVPDTVFDLLILLYFT